MDNKAINKSDQTRKEPLDERKKDRGDNLKKQEAVKGRVNDESNPKTARKSPSRDQGDVPAVKRVPKIPKTISTVKKIDKVTDRSKKQIEIKPKLTANISSRVNTGAEKTSLNKTSETCNAPAKIKLGERNVSDKVRPKASNIQNQGKEKIAGKSDWKTDCTKNQISLKSASRELMSDSVKLDSVKTDSDAVKREQEMTRKPLIKTVKSKNDNKVYKAVTFTEQKRIKPTVLEINIPNTQAKKTKLVDKNLEVKPVSVQGSNKSSSKLNIKAKSQYTRRNRLSERIKRKKLSRCISSPDKFKKTDSPPTEVAKWAPSCLNTHTKPYYEAWVNTTLAAISKISTKDKLFFEKQNIINTFQKSLELGTESPDLVHESFTDECYTGKITIKQKNLSKRARQPHIAPLIDPNKQHNN